MVTLKSITNDIGLEYEGDGNIEIIKVCGLEKLSEGGIGFITNISSVPALEEIYDTSKELTDQINIDKVIMIQPKGLDTPFKNRIISDDPLVTHVQIAEMLNPPVYRSGKIHETATIGENTIIGDGVTIDPKAVIYDGVSIGEGSVIRAGVIVMNDAKIGKNCILYPNVVVRDSCFIGDNVAIHPNSVIGGDGHGYYQRDGKNHKIPQVGRVIIEDDVEIGSCSTVDRGRLEDTIIKKGTKIDNHVQVAHNVEIGEQSLISGHSAIGGSTKIGNNLIMAGFSAISDNRKIGNNVIISGAACVAGNLKDGSFVGGTPARPFKKWKKSVAYIGNLSSLFKKVNKIEKSVEELKKIK